MPETRVSPALAEKTMATVAKERATAMQSLLQSVLGSTRREIERDGSKIALIGSSTKTEKAGSKIALIGSRTKNDKAGSKIALVGSTAKNEKAGSKIALVSSTAKNEKAGGKIEKGDSKIEQAG